MRGRIVLSVKDVLEIVGASAKAINYQGVRIELTKQKTGYGFKTFFKCPLCNQRRTDLYIKNEYIYCRTCSPTSIYWGIQNTTRGGTLEFEYRMRRIARKHDIEYKAPFSYYEFLLQSPDKNVKEWSKAIRKLQVLENMRFQTIFYKRKYDSKLISYVLENCLDLYDLCDIERYSIDWSEVVSLQKKWLRAGHKYKIVS